MDAARTPLAWRLNGRAQRAARHTAAWQRLRTRDLRSCLTYGRSARRWRYRLTAGPTGRAAHRRVAALRTRDLRSCLTYGRSAHAVGVAVKRSCPTGRARHTTAWQRLRTRDLRSCLTYGRGPHAVGVAVIQSCPTGRARHAAVGNDARTRDRRSRSAAWPRPARRWRGG